MELWFLQQLEIMEILTVYEIVIIASALVGTYVKMNIEINKVKSRIFVLEQNHSEITTMLRILITVSILVVLSAAVIIYLVNLHNGGIKDIDKDFIPDSVEEKTKQIKEEIAQRHANVKLEIEDVTKAIGDAIDGLDDIPKAAAGAKRKGRPRQ
jgi:predicted transcriptional regulator YheO